MNAMNLKPLGNWLLIEPLPFENTNKIVLPENVRPDFGGIYSRVLAVGPKVQTVKVGDRVYSFSHSVGAQDVPSSKLKLIDENQVLLILADREIA